MESSGTVLVAITRKPSFFRMSATAGPEISARSPRAQESLTVTTAALKAAGADPSFDFDCSVIEEDIFLLFPGSAARSADGGGCVSRGDGAANAVWRRLSAAFALRFVEQAQSLHQQTLRVEFGSFLIGLALKVEFEVAASPAQNFEDRFIAGRRSVGRVLYLSFDKADFALVAQVIQLELAALAAHFQRLHQVDHVHLREVPAHHAVRGRGLCHLLKRDTIDGALDAARAVLEEERFDQIVVGGILRR